MGPAAVAIGNRVARSAQNGAPMLPAIQGGVTVVMGRLSRRAGISALIACQNEEVTVGWSVLSFLEFADEIIVVDNGSSDASKEICREMARRHPEKVRYYDVPRLNDLYENRQYAFERSTYQWVIRADADFVCYTSGAYDCRKLRQHILARGRVARPAIYWLPQVTVSGDFWHIRNEGELGTKSEPGPFGPGSKAMPRIYRVVPGMRFARLGRWEGVRHPRWARRWLRTVEWPTPIWMHCDIKSVENAFFRRYRTDWRELGDYRRYPTLRDYAEDVTRPDRGDEELMQYALRVVEPRMIANLQRYDPAKWAPYPRWVEKAMQQCPVYRIEDEGGIPIRRYLGARTDQDTYCSKNGDDGCQ